MNLKEKYRPSKPCSCDICKSYCLRPGWWTVDEADNAIRAGLSNRMMLEISPENSFGVLSPAFKGNESNYAFQLFSKNGCTFMIRDYVNYLVRNFNQSNVGFATTTGKD